MRPASLEGMQAVQRLLLQHLESPRADAEIDVAFGREGALDDALLLIGVLLRRGDRDAAAAIGACVVAWRERLGRAVAARASENVRSFARFTGERSRPAATEEPPALAVKPVIFARRVR